MLPAGAVLFDEPVSRHSVSGAGGPAEAFVTVEDIAELMKVQAWSLENNCDYRFWGMGGSTLVRDGGVSGIIIKLGRGFAALDLERQQADEAFVRVGAACSAAHLAQLCAARGFSGAGEFAEYGGTVAGALFAKGREADSTFTSAIEELTIVTKDGKELTIRGQALRFDTSTALSINPEHTPPFRAGSRRVDEGALRVPRTSAVTRILLKLKASGEAVAQDDAQEVDGLTTKRLTRVFFSPCKTKASELIDEIGLRGVRVGKARVASDDANSIVNEGTASARDFAVLMNLVRDRVKEQTDITLQQLIEVIGER